MTTPGPYFAYLDPRRLGSETCCLLGHATPAKAVACAAAEREKRKKAKQ